MGGAGGDRRWWPAGLAGALALIAAAEAVVARHELDLTAPTRMEWRLSRRAATDWAPGRPVLGLGTSMAKLGLYPPVVERESGRRAYNLAHCAGRLPGAYYLLRRALGAGARPEAILLEVHPTYLALPFRDGPVAWPDLLGPLDCLDLAREARDPAFFAATMLAWALPSVNARAEIRSAVADAFRGQLGVSRAANSALVRNLDRNSGAFVHRRDVPYAGEVSPHLAGMYLPPSWSADGLNERYLRRILDLCAAGRIRVYWLIPPFVPELQAGRERTGLDESYTRFAGRIQAEYPGVVVLDARRAGYPHPAFFDAAHLDFPGALAYSAEVGRIVAEGPPKGDGPRWVALPAYRATATDAPLEDMAQSSREVAAAAAATARH